MELDFDKIFKIPTKALNISRAHPYIPRDWKWALQFCIVHGLFTLAFVNIIYNIICHDLKSNNFSQMCKNGVLFVVYIVITFQYCVLLWHQNALVDLIENMKRDYEQSKDLDSIEKEMFTKYVNLGIWVCKQWLVISIVGTGIFVVKNVVIMLYYYFISEFQLVPLYDLVYPSMIERNKDNIFVFLMTYGLMLLFGSYSALMYIAYVPLGPIFMLHACGQLELVAKRIDDLFVECDNAVISKKLKSIIMQLQYIYSFVDRIKQIFKVAYELTLKGSTIMLPITCYEVLEGENVRLSLYTCGWELHYDRRTRTTLQLMLQNALTPIAINTIFRALCLDALTDLFQQSYAIFNLMNAMWG